ncbi:MAG: Rdx family protein [Gemmatimonadaceae bacterium]|nr:Rdx family protein [Gemmatimonadaceae bacterium]
MAAEVRQAFPDAEVDLVASGGGRFEVLRDGQPVFEKSRLRRHATPGEVVRLLRAADTPP